MSGLIESATAIMRGSERRLATIANNVANATTPGFRRQISFSDAVADRSARPYAATSLQVGSDFSPGRLSQTSNALDLAISGPGFFQLRAGDQIIYSRQGQFRRTAEGTLATPQGHLLQQSGGGDLVLDREAVEVLSDGAVLDGDRPVARIALFAPADPSMLQPLGGSAFTAAGEMEEVAEPGLRQGMVEASNVTLSDEMTAMMATLRHAETGARLVTVYDELLGRAIQTLGQVGR